VASAGSAGWQPGAVAGVEAEFVGADGVMRREPLSGCWNLAFERVAPVRGFASFRGQRNRPGLWWFATTGEHVGHESWLERDRLMALDADLEVVGVAAQPMWLHWATESGRPVRHAPDYFARRADGTGVVIDVRADQRIGDRDAEVFAATARVCAQVGWDYQRAGELGPVQAANLRWLSGYRHPRFAQPGLAARLAEVFAQPGPLLAKAAVEQAIAVYNSDELDTDPGNGGDNNVHLKDWLAEGRRKLDEAREAVRYLCEPVFPPREVEQFLHYFCGDAADPNALTETEAIRVAFYKAVAVFARAFAAVAQDLTEAGYSDAEAAALKADVDFYSEIRSAIKKHSGEELDIKPYEADMRHLLNTYVQADPAADLGKLGEMSLTELIVETGIHDAIARKLNERGKLSRNAIAEGIINNVRKTIVRDQLTDPRFYEQMSKLLTDLIKQSRADAAAYEEFLRKAEALVKRLAAKQPDEDVPAALHGKREATVIYNNLPRILAAGPGMPAGVEEALPEHKDGRVRLALEIDQVMRERAPAGWKGDQAREAQVLNGLYPLLHRDREATLALFELIKNQPEY